MTRGFGQQVREGFALHSVNGVSVSANGDHWICRVRYHRLVQMCCYSRSIKLHVQDVAPFVFATFKINIPTSCLSTLSKSMTLFLQQRQIYGSHASMSGWEIQRHNTAIFMSPPQLSRLLITQQHHLCHCLVWGYTKSYYSNFPCTTGRWYGLGQGKQPGWRMCSSTLRIP